MNRKMKLEALCRTLKPETPQDLVTLYVNDNADDTNLKSIRRQARLVFDSEHALIVKQELEERIRALERRIDALEQRPDGNSKFEEWYEATRRRVYLDLKATIIDFQNRSEVNPNATNATNTSKIHIVGRLLHLIFSTSSMDGSVTVVDDDGLQRALDTEIRWQNHQRKQRGVNRW